jgi:hypothetical protein
VALEASNPGLEVFTPGDVHACSGDDEVLGHEAVDRCRITGRPNLLPEGFDKGDGCVMASLLVAALDGA